MVSILKFSKIGRVKILQINRLLKDY